MTVTMTQTNKIDYAAVAAELMREEYEYCARDVVYWANHYCVIEDMDAEEVVVPFRGWDAQNRCLQEFRENRLNLILKARQMGITWISLYFCVHDLLFNRGHKVIALSKTETDAQELVRRVGVILENQPEILAAGGLTYTINAGSVKIYSCEDTLVSTFKAFPSSPSAGRSFTCNILLLDEWAFQEWADKIWTSAYPTINRPTGGKVIGVSTIMRGTLFERLWVEENQFHKIFLSVFCDPRRDEAWYKRTAVDLGVKVKQEYPRTAEEALANIGGSFFPEFDYSMHTCEPFEIDSGWSVYNTMDYGLDMFAHYKIAISNDGNVYVFHEIYESGLIISEASARIKLAETWMDDNEKKHTWHMPRERLAPPDMWNRSQESGKSKALLFAENGINLTKTSNDRVAGWLALKELLKPVQNEEGKTSARLHIFRTCTNLIRCFPQILIDEKNVDDCAKDPHELTHALDAVRGFAIYWATPSSNETKKKVHYPKDMLEDWRHGTDEEREQIERRMGGIPE